MKKTSKTLIFAAILALTALVSLALYGVEKTGSVNPDNIDLIPMKGSCCQLTVSGCGKTAKVCYNQDCSLAVQSQAKDAFKSAYSCSSATVNSYVGSCGFSGCNIGPM